MAASTLTDNDKKEIAGDLIDLEAGELFGWKKELIDAMKAVAEKNSLPEGSLSLNGNISRKDGTVSSYSICIYEPSLIEETHDSSRNTIVLRLSYASQKGNTLKVELRRPELFDQLDIPFDAEVKRPEKGNAYMRIDETSVNLVPFLIKCVEESIKAYSSKESRFACCARYKQCSEKGHCVHPNMLFSTACAYRKNLDKGNNFLK